MNKKILLEYLRTFLLTILASIMLLVFVIVAIQHSIVSEVTPSEPVHEDTVDYKLIGMLIDKNKYREEMNPKNYKINLKLGELYEIKGDDKNAEIEFKKAIAKAPYGEYKPTYKLSRLYLKLNRLDEAQALMDNCGEHPDKELILNKAEIYQELGNKYYNKADYDNASFKYEKAMRYYGILKSKKTLELKGDLASSYVYLAETKLSQLEVDQAIEYLQLSNSIIDSPIIKYKLAIILMGRDPKQAYEYLETVFKKAPEIINYETYERLLLQLATEAEASGDYAQAGLYRYQEKRIKDYSSKNIISIDAISLESAEGEFTYSPLRQKYYINFECMLKNISQDDIEKLFLQIDFEAKHNIIYTYKQPIADDKLILTAGTSAPIISVKVTIPHIRRNESTDKINAKIYLSKTEDSYRLFLKNVPLKKKAKKRYIIQIFGLKFYLPRFEF